MRRSVAAAAVAVAAGCALTGCGSTESPATAVTNWAVAGTFEQGAKYLIVDANRVHDAIRSRRPVAVVRTNCLELYQEADGENTDLLPTPDAQLTSLLSKGYDAFVHAAAQCSSDAGSAATLAAVDLELRGALGDVYAAVFREEAVTGNHLGVPGLQ
jgi:hypothetical protein